MAHDALLDSLRILAQLELLPLRDRRLAAETAAKLGDALIYVAVIGEFKRGKSTLINALLREDVLPTGITPVTAIPTLVRFGSAARLIIQWLDDSESSAPLAQLPDYVTEKGNPGNRKRVREVVVEYPAPLLASGLVLVDTPGTGSVHRHNTETTTQFLPHIDVALLVLTVDAPLSEAEAQLLGAVGGTAARIAVCLNKTDLLGPEEVEEAIGFVRPVIGEAVKRADVTVFPVSARAARAGDTNGSGLALLHQWLEDVAIGGLLALMDERARRVATSLLAVADVALQMERGAAARSARDARVARDAFEGARQQLECNIEEDVTLMRAAFRRATATVIDPRAQRLRESLPATLLAGSDTDWQMSLEAAAASWTREVEAALAGAVTASLNRHTERLQERVTRFVQQAGDAFGITLPQAPDVREDLTIPAIHVEWPDEPGALEMGLRQLRRRLPGPLGRQWRERVRRQRAAEDADRVAGRLRYAALQAVDTATRAWAGDVEVTWRSLADAMAAAVERGERAVEHEGLHVAHAENLASQLESIRAALDGE